jgi:S-adenosylmethionine:diacylglycerol 3-amino-3-carboxypropyl transferase
MTVDVRLQPELTEATAWREGRLHVVQGKQRLLFGQVYEDVAVERGSFAQGGRVFCIASAGCTALALCEDHNVVACDINPAQIEYVKRRLAGGPRELGVADKVMSFLRGFMPLAGWTRTKLLRFLSMDDLEAQAAYFVDQLDNWRFRYGLDLLLSPLSLRGAYSASLLACLPPRFGAVMRGRMQRCFARHPNRTNPYARALLLGSSEPVRRVPAPSPAAAARIELVLDDAAAYLERCPPGSFAGLALSNVLDGAGALYEERLMSAVRRAACPGAIVVRRSFGEPPAELPTNRAADDRSMIWGIVDVRKVEES